MPTKLITHIKNNSLIIFALLLMLLHLSVGCSVRKEGSHNPKLRNSQTNSHSQMEQHSLGMPVGYDFTARCEKASRWNQFWCTLIWTEFTGQFTILEKTIDAQSGQYQLLVDGGQEILVLDLNNNTIFTFVSPIDILVNQDATVEEFQAMLNTKFPISELRLEGPLTIHTEEADLNIKANQIFIQDRVLIQSFSPQVKAQKKGRSGGRITIIAEEILGDSLSIDVRGENGGDGEDGKDLSLLSADNGKNGGFCYLERAVKLEGRGSVPFVPTCQCTIQVPHNNQAIYVVRYVAESLWPTNGVNGRKGSPGLPGYSGGNAGQIHIQANHSYLRNFATLTDGGLGGNGGVGGKGERGGTRGQLDPISECTPQNFKVPLDGMDGPRGENGYKGINGKNSTPELKGISMSSNSKFN